MKAVDAMTRDVIVIPPELDLTAVWRMMQRESIRHLPVVKGGTLIGMLSDRDLLKHGTVDVHGAMVFSKQAVAMHVMSPAPVTCGRLSTVGRVARYMVELKIDAVPVVDEHDRLVGLVTSTDLLMLLTDDDDTKPLPFHFRVRGAEEVVA